VSLPHLKFLRIHDQAAHSILLNHLHIPTGASATLEFECGYDRFPISDHHPRSLDNLGNISYITSINLNLRFRPAIRLKGPSGDLHMVGYTTDFFPRTLDTQALQFLNELPISSTERLTISWYVASADSNTEESAAYQTLLTMNRLRTLTLTDCINLSFILALNPDHNASNTVLSPKLENLVLNTAGRRDGPFFDELLEMAKARASMGARLSAITMVCLPGLISKEKVPDLRNYAGNFEYGFDGVTLRRDAVGYDSD